MTGKFTSKLLQVKEPLFCYCQYKPQHLFILMVNYPPLN